MNEMRVHFYLKRNEEKEDGTIPVLGRISIGKSMVQFSAKLSVPLSLWDTKSGRAIGKSKCALRVNGELDKMCVAIHSAYKELLEKKDDVSASEVKNMFQGISSEQETLIRHFEACNDSFRKTVGISRTLQTYKRYGVSLNHLKRFLRKKYNLSDIPFQSLTPDFISAFDFYLRVDLKFAQATIVNIVGHLRKIVKSAINNGLIQHDPFIDYKYDSVPLIPKSLTEKELKKIIKTPLAKPNLNLVRDMFLFSAFTGVAFSDMRNLAEKNIVQAEDGVWWIHTARQKTGTPCHIPLLELPLKLIDKYRGLGKNGRLFPMLSCSKTNINLKKIAAKCKIDKRLTFHMARHTYASVVTLSQGVPIDTVSELLGHRDWRSTRIYARVSNEKLNEDMRHLQKRISSKSLFNENKLGNVPAE